MVKVLFAAFFLLTSFSQAWAIGEEDRRGPFRECENNAYVLAIEHLPTDTRAAKQLKDRISAAVMAHEGPGALWTRGSDVGDEQINIVLVSGNRHAAAVRALAELQNNFRTNLAIDCNVIAEAAAGSAAPQ